MGLVEVSGRVNEQGKLELNEPVNLLPGPVRVYIKYIDPELQKPRKAESAQGQIKMADDFDAPLDDFKEYME